MDLLCQQGIEGPAHSITNWLAAARCSSKIAWHLPWDWLRRGP